MRKLLLLLPALALASCSGGHDLMSNEQFLMTCPGRDLTSELEIEHELLASPEMPRATLRIKGRKGTEQDWELAVVSSKRLIFWSDPIAIHIDRESGRVDWGLKDTADEELEQPEQLKGCWFKTL